MELNRIYNENCLNTMEKIPDGSVDFVFSDPPYNKNKNYEIYKDNLPEDKYWEFVANFISEYRRISNNQFGIFIGSELTKKYWDLVPDAKLIIVRKGAIGTPFKTYYYQYFSFLVTKKPNFQIYDLWDKDRMPGEGYFFREERFPNPGLTSLNLTRRIISYFTEENNLIYDGFMGVGTTAVACISLNRKYLGSELNPEYIEIAKNRIEKEQSKLLLFN